MQADLPLTAAIRQSQQTVYHSHPPHPADRQGESCPQPARPWLWGLRRRLLTFPGAVGGARQPLSSHGSCSRGWEAEATGLL